MGFASGFAAYKKKLLEQKDEALRFEQQMAVERMAAETEKIKQNSYKAFMTLFDKVNAVSEKTIQEYNSLNQKFRENFIKAKDPEYRKLIVSDYNKKIEALNNRAGGVARTTKAIVQRLGIDPKLAGSVDQIVPQFPLVQIEQTKDGKFVLNQISPDGKVLGRFQTDWDKIADIYSGTPEGTSEFERNLKRLYEAGLIDKKKMYEFILRRTTKQINPEMYAMQKDFETYANLEAEVADQLGVPPSKLATIDIRQLDEPSKARAQELAYAWIRAYKPKVSAKVIDKINQIAVTNTQLADAFDLTAQMLQRGENINAVEKLYRETIGKYFGMSPQQYEKLYRDSRFKGAINVIRHGLFGSALTKNEKQEFLEYIPSLYTTNKAIVKGIKSLVRDRLTELDTIKRTVGSKPFNLLYGDIYRNLKELNELIDKGIKRKSKPKEVENLTAKYLNAGDTAEQATQAQPQVNEPEWKKYLE